MGTSLRNWVCTFSGRHQIKLPLLDKLLHTALPASKAPVMPAAHGSYIRISLQKHAELSAAPLLKGVQLVHDQQMCRHI